ncbi:MAG: hypothetical protein M3211_01825 [Actinomycetota bacterium]|nr:hypothetical protein [Actinomycetota bacterium]
MRAHGRRTVAVLVAVLAAVVTGCGPEVDAGRAPRGDRPHAAVSVRLVVSGGLGGTREVFEVGGGAPSPGLSSADVDRALTLAGDDAVRDVARDRVRGSVPCCDLRRYELTMRYVDGSRARLVTYETRPAPPELRRLVALLASARGEPTGGASLAR